MITDDYAKGSSCSTVTTSNNLSNCSNENVIEEEISYEYKTTFPKILHSSEKFDVIIGSDLVYCESDAQGVSKVASCHLSEKGILIILVPQPQHRYGTEYIVPSLVSVGLTVYSRVVSLKDSTSPALKVGDSPLICNSFGSKLLGNPLSTPVLGHLKHDKEEEGDKRRGGGGRWKWVIHNNNNMDNDSSSCYAEYEPIDQLSPQHEDDSKFIDTFLTKLTIDDRYILCDIDEREYVAWNLIVAHWKGKFQS